MTEIRRFHRGCGDIAPSDRINPDSEKGPGIDISANILEGLPLDDDIIDPYPEITGLDSREGESFYVEAFK